MNDTHSEIPLYSKVAQFMVAIISVIFVLYIGSEIILPILFSLLIAVLLNPIVSFLHSKRIPRVIAISIVILFSMLLIVGLIFFIISQASLFSKMLPQLKIQFSVLSQETISWISNNINISTSKVEEWLIKSIKSGASDVSSIVGQTIVSVSSGLVIVFLMPIYVFLILYYKPLLLDFISKIFAKQKQLNIAGIFFDSKKLIQSYLVGLLIESAIISAMNIVGLLIIGVDFAVILGIVGGLLNIIPYIGGVVAVILPMLIALTTQSPIAALWVLVVYVIVQFIDNNIVMPYVVSAKVKINALASIIVVLIGGAIWGVSGMFLSIPLTAISKVVFDRIDSLKPFGALLGDTMPLNDNTIFKKFKRKK